MLMSMVTHVGCICCIVMQFVGRFHCFVYMGKPIDLMHEGFFLGNPPKIHAYPRGLVAKKIVKNIDFKGGIPTFFFFSKRS